MKTRKVAVDTMIMFVAQRTVDRWLHSDHRGPFNRMIERLENYLWDDQPGSNAQKKAFRRAANAIRVGKGHARENPAPVYDIVHRTLEERRS